MTGPPRKTRIKICGITSTETAAVAVEAGIDAIGLVFEVTDSPRCLTIDEAHAIKATLPSLIMAIVVLKNPPETLAEQWKGTWVQLHGDEDETVVQQFARTKHVIRGFHFDPQQVRRWNACPHVEILLIDGPAGGRGEGFDHEALARLMPQIEKPVMLAGGLTPDTVAGAIRAVRPFAVDVSSGVETSPGVKDPALIRAFFAAVAAADAE